MVENVTSGMNALMYTAHGIKRPQGMLAIVNSKVALTYVEGSGDRRQVVGYTYLDEIMQRACSSQLPEYRMET